jgi:hypothetical protein
VARAPEKPLAVRDEIRLVVDDQDGSSHSLPSTDEQEQSWCQGGRDGKVRPDVPDGCPEGEPGARPPHRGRRCHTIRAGCAHNP